MTTSNAVTAPETEGTVPVNVHIMNKEYKVQCPPKEKHQLIQAALDVDTRMRAVRGDGANISTEKSAVMAALNLANELQGSTNSNDALESVSDRIIDMTARIELALSEAPETPETPDPEPTANSQIS